MRMYEYEKHEKKERERIDSGSSSSSSSNERLVGQSQYTTQRRESEPIDEVELRKQNVKSKHTTSTECAFRVPYTLFAL